MGKYSKYAMTLTGTFAAAFLTVMKPARRGRVSLAGFQNYDYAHRGLHNEEEGIPENTMPAFERAAEAGFGIELDVHLTRDGEVVVFHDDTLTRACGCPKRIEETDSEELFSYGLFGTEERIPKFRQVLDLVAGRTPLIIELKSDNKPGSSQYVWLCERVAACLNEYPGVFAVESFDPRVLYWFRKHHGELVRGQLVEHFRRHGTMVYPAYDFAARNLCFNFLTKPDFIAYQYLDRDCLALKLVKFLYRPQEFSWTVRDPKTAKLLKRDGSLVIFEGYHNRKKKWKEQLQNRAQVDKMIDMKKILGI